MVEKAIESRTMQPRSLVRCPSLSCLLELQFPLLICHNSNVRIPESVVAFTSSLLQTYHKFKYKCANKLKHVDTCQWSKLRTNKCCAMDSCKKQEWVK